MVKITGCHQALSHSATEKTRRENTQGKQILYTHTHTYVRESILWLNFDECGADDRRWRDSFAEKGDGSKSSINAIFW